MDAVLLIAFGGPTRPDEIRPFLQNVTRGRRIPPERLESVAQHYELLGGKSPMNELTFRQADGLRRALGSTPVYVGMRNREPYIADTMAQMTADGVKDAVAVILSPHASEASRERYMASVDEARGPDSPSIRYVASWHLHPLFIATWKQAIAATNAGDAQLVFTAHSIPVAAAQASPYVREIEETAAAVAGDRPWRLAWQSRSGSPRDPWLEPDVNDVLRELAARNTKRVVVAPIGFVCDHVEVLYDLDVEARATADGLGIDLKRASTCNDHPLFVEMLADVVRSVA
jgi:ferrochelatase